MTYTDYKTAGETKMFADDTTLCGIADTYDQAILLIKEIIMQVGPWRPFFLRLHIYFDSSVELVTDYTSAP